MGTMLVTDYKLPNKSIKFFILHLLYKYMHPVARQTESKMEHLLQSVPQVEADKFFEKWWDDTDTDTDTDKARV